MYAPGTSGDSALTRCGTLDELSPATMADPARTEFALKAMTGFGRLFASYMSALNNSSGGEQRVTVRLVCKVLCSRSM